jgi:hypothetical protein
MAFKSKDNFEAVYLKNNSLKKAFANENKEKIEALRTRKDFNRCIKFLSKNVFIKNRSDLLNLGFDYDDMYNICLTFGLAFATEDLSNFKTDKDLYYVLMRYVNQRLESFLITLDRKFHYKESYTDVSIESIGMNNLDLNLGPSSNDNSDEMEIMNTEYDKLYILFEKSEGLDKKRLAKELARKKTDIDKLEYTKQSISKMSKQKLNNYKKELNENVHNYSEKLAYLATYKKVEHSVRKKARLLCKKSGINYTEIMNKLIESRNLNRVDYTFG